MAKVLTLNGDVLINDGDALTIEQSGGSANLTSLTITPSESLQTITPSGSIDGYDEVTCNAISSTYIGSGITQRSSTDLSANGATVTAPAGYYAEAATKSVTSGSATAASSISATGASVTTGANTLTLSKTVSNTPQVSAGYVSSGTAGDSSVSLTASVTTKGATTYTPTTSDQTIASGTYLTGAQTISGDSDLVAGNIKKDVTIFGVTGSYEGSQGATLQVSKSYTVDASGSATISPDNGYDGMEEVALTVPAQTLPTSIAASATSGYTSKATISRSTSDQYLNIPTGYNDAGAYYKVEAVANGSVTAPSSISGSSATLTTGTNTITLSKTVSNTPNVTTAGYISSGTAGNTDISLTASVNTRSSTDLTADGATVTAPAGYYASDATKSVSSGSATGPSSISESSATLSTGTNTLTLTKTGVSTTPTVSAGYVSSATSSTATVALTASITTKGATTYTPGTTDQTISSGTYLTGTQTISGDADLVAGNIKKDVTIFGVTGTYEGGSNGYFTVTDTTDTAGGTIRTITPTTGTPVVQSGRTVEITENGTTTIQPSSGCTAMEDVEVTVNVAGSGGSGIPSDLPNDGATRLGYYIDEGTPLNRMTAYIRCTPSVSNGTVIDWGDNSTTTTDSTSAKNYSHTYTAIPSNGYYIIKISCTSGTVSFIGSSSSYETIWGPYRNTVIENSNGDSMAYPTYNENIRWMVIGTNCSQIGNYGFGYMSELEEVEIKGSPTIATNAFVADNIRKLTISGAPTLSSNCFSIRNVREVNFGSVTSFPASTLVSTGNYLYSLTIPATVTSIADNAFIYVTTLTRLRFNGTTPPTLASSYVFSLQSDCIIIVPYGKVFYYIEETNYPESTYYGGDHVYIGFGTFTNGASLPTMEDENELNLTWYATIDDCLAQTNSISAGNGNEIYCRYSSI